MAMHVAAGWTWAGKATTSGTVVYVTAEGAMGFRKRMVAFRQELKPPASTPFYLISDTPRLMDSTNRNPVVPMAPFRTNGKGPGKRRDSE